MWETSLPSMNSTTAAWPWASQTKKWIGIGIPWETRIALSLAMTSSMVPLLSSWY